MVVKTRLGGMVVIVSTEEEGDEIGDVSSELVRTCSSGKVLLR